MGYRAHIIKKYEVEVGDCLGFNYGMEEFSSMLEKLDLSYCEGEYYFEVDSTGLLALKEKGVEALDLDEEEREAVEAMVKMAETADYAKNGWVRVHWY